MKTLIFWKNYTGRVEAGSRIAPKVADIKIWNVRDRNLEHYGRTDNESEGFNNKLSRSIEVHSLNLCKFLKVLQGIQAETERSILHPE